MKRLGKINRKPVVEGNPNKLKPTDTTLKEACGCDGIEDNLSKVEKAYILDYTKNYDDYRSFIEQYNLFPSCVTVADVLVDQNYISFYHLARMFALIGFTVSTFRYENDSNFNAIKSYFIEVPVEDFYNLSNNHRVYFVKRNLSYQERLEDVIRIINDKFPNLKEEEEVIPNGYIIPLPLKSFDNWGVITAIKKLVKGI